MRDSVITFALLSKQEVGLSSSRQVRDTVTSIQENRALAVGQCSIGLDLEGLVVAEVARKEKEL
jgi:hypothetical protein